MTITISQTDYDELWQHSSHSSQPSEQSDSSDIIKVCPKQFGRGYERWIQLHGIKLLIVDEELYDDLRIKYQPHESCSYVEFGFNLSGDRSGRPSGINFLDWSIGGEFDEGGIFEALAGERILKVDIHLESPNLLSRFTPENIRQFPPELRRLIEETDPQFYSDTGKITPAMQLALKQLLNCPYQGLTKQFYLESKCLELIALKLDQLAKSETTKKPKVIKSDDIERIHHARNILIENLDNPPSLLELARQVGLNDRKLKQGFRHCFDTTTFSYLQDYRMAQAKRLLEERKMNINEVVRAVGYASRSAFYTAFKKKFGVSPSNYLA